MLKTRFKSHVGLALLVAGLFCLCATQAMAQTPEEPDPPQLELVGTPGYIAELIDQTELTPEQVDQMRGDDAGWGNIMIATRLAEQIAANSPEDAKLTFEQALQIVLAARAQNKGFGQIAHEHNLKVGDVVEGQDNPNGSSSPRYIAVLVEKTELTQEQVDQMRGDAAGWGNIMLATRLAERILADSTDPDLTFEDALNSVLAARAEGMGFGDIAHANNLKLGPLVSRGNKSLGEPPEPPATEGALVRTQARIGREGKPKKQNMFGRFFGMFRSGRTAGGEKPLRPERPDRPERPNKPEKIEKPERPDRPERPERPEKLERPVKPEKPEKPGKGLGR